MFTMYLLLCIFFLYLVDEDSADIVTYLKRMTKEQIKLLGQELGLLFFTVDGMTNLPQDMVAAWLRMEDKVTEKCGDPLTWEVLVKALKKIGQNGIANTILREKGIYIAVFQ